MKPLPDLVRHAAAGLVVSAVCLLGSGRSVADEPPAEGRPAMSQLSPAEAAAAVPPPPEELTFARGSGGGVSLLTLGLWCLLVIGWVASTEWLAKDEARTSDFSTLWLPLLTGPFFVAAVAGWWLPLSVLALLVTAVAWIAPLAAYVWHRDAAAQPDARLCTYARLEQSVNPLIRRFGLRLPPPLPPLGEVLPDAGIITAAELAGDARPAGLEELPGYAELRRLVQRAVAGRASQIRIDFDKENAHVSHRIDGVYEPARQLIMRREKRRRVEHWRQSPPLDREGMAAVLEALKAVSGFGSGHPTGSFAIAVGRNRLPCTVKKESAGAVRRVVIGIDKPRARFSSLADLGMDEKLCQIVAENIGYEQGLVIVSSPAGEGLSTTVSQLLMSADRLTREFVVIESAARPVGEMQNVEPYRWGQPPHATAVDALRAARQKYPTVICVPRLDADASLASELAALASEILVVVGVEAGSAAEAIDRVLTAGMPRDAVARELLMSLGQRLIRKLCPNCAEAIKPSGKLLEWLKLPDAASVQIKKPAADGCADCGGIGYLGRTAMFQVAAGVTVNKAIAKQVDHKVLVQAATHDGMAAFKDVGRGLVAHGVTAVDEVQRVLKRD